MPGTVKPCDELTLHSGGGAILLVTSCYRNWDKLQPDRAPDSNVALPFFTF